MPNFAGTWKMRSSENFDELLKALGELGAGGRAGATKRWKGTGWPEQCGARCRPGRLGAAARGRLRALPGDLPHRSARSRGFSARGCGAAFRPPAPSRTGAGRAGELKLCFLPASPRCQRHAQEGGGGGRLQTPRGDPPGRGPVLHQNFHHCPHHGDQLQNRGELRGGDGGWPKMQGKKRAVCTVSVCVCVCER